MVSVPGSAVLSQVSHRLFGRERELATIDSRLAAALTGHLQVVLLAGEPGIGKTRLLDEAAAKALSEGVTVLRGGASEEEGMPPYLPFLEALGSYVHASTAERLGEQMGSMSDALATILPELPQRLGRLPQQHALPLEQARWRLYSAVGDFLAIVAQPNGLLLILDDLQFADPSTLDLLTYIVRHQPAGRLLILGAYRAGDARERMSFERMLFELNRTRLLTTISLSALAPADLASVAASLLGSVPHPELTRLLADQSEGNPFFAEELLRNWQETGVIAQRDDRWTLVKQERSTLPPTVAAAVRQRLARVNPTTVELLRAAAIIGRSFDIALLAAVAGQDTESVQEQLREAVRAGLLKSGSDETLSFEHDKIRECLYEEVVPLRRRRLHGLIGRALETPLASTGAGRLADLAYHFGHSGERERAATYAIQAGDQAMRAYAAEEAQHHYRVALSALDAGDSRRGVVLVDLGIAAELAGNEKEAAGAFEAAVTWYQQGGDQVGSARAAHQLGRAYWRQEAIPEALRAFENAVSLLVGTHEAALAEAQVDLGSLLVVNLHRHAEGQRYLGQAVELARELGDARLEAAATRALGNLLVRTNNLQAGIDLLESALQLAETSDSPAEIAESSALLGLANAWAGDLRRVESLLPRWLAAANRCHDPYQLRHVTSWQAWSLLQLGRFEAAGQVLAEARPYVERLASPEPLATHYSILSALHYQRGEYRRSEELAREAVAIFRSIGPQALIWYLGMLGIALAAQGKDAEAHDNMAELESLIAGHPPGTMPTAEPLTYMAIMAVRLTDRPAAGQIYPRLLAFQGQFHDFLIDRLLGQLACLLGKWPEGQSHLATGLKMAEANGLLLEQVYVREAWAALELNRGGPESQVRARMRLSEALSICEAAGIASEIARLQERLRGLREAGKHTDLPAGLSPREAEVLRLVATGKSNREIADQLVVSERTVANHMASIFNKLAVDNRAAASAFAVRHGLAD